MGMRDIVQLYTMVNKSCMHKKKLYENKHNTNTVYKGVTFCGYSWEVV